MSTSGDEGLPAQPKPEFTEALHALDVALHRGRLPELSVALEAEGKFVELLTELIQLSDFVFAVSRGDLSGKLKATGMAAGALKALQASLRHLTWQAKRIAEGDFSQRVDFMGEFSQAFNSMVVSLEQALSDLAERNEELQALTARLEDLASTDPLTGARNRRRFNEIAEVELARALRYGYSLSFLIFDIDHFKKVNDTYGHEAGDSVLITLVELVTKWIRDDDYLARWGGEEFVILASHNDIAGARVLGERLRKGVEKHDFAGVGRVTASFGAAQYREGETLTELTARADEALYRAKELGRNRVEVAS